MFNFKKHGMKKNYVTTAVALLLLAGCSNDIKETDIQFTGDTGAKVSFSAVINNHEASNLVTRATETNWEAEDSVGITCGTEQVNIHYKYKGNGLFAAKGGNAEEIWVLGSGEYDVVAYAPFSGTSGEEQPALEVTTASENQATAEERAKIDFLFAKGGYITNPERDISIQSCDESY